jgi:transposase
VSATKHDSWKDLPLMMSQEEYMHDIKPLREQGWTLEEIGAHTGYHPATISNWLKRGGPPAGRAVPESQRVITAAVAERVEGLLRRSQNRLLATSIYETLVAEGYDGSYSAVVRYVRDRRGPRFSPAATVSVPIETAPGEEGQFDFSDCDQWAARWGWEPATLTCFVAILCWSRWRRWWFTTSEDRHHTLEGLVQFYEAAGGVPQVSRTDRMGALGQSQGRRFRLVPAVVGFGNHYGTQIKACQARDAKRKGKVERPNRVLKESFLEEMSLDPPADVGELNRRVGPWLEDRVHSRPHRVTGEAPNDRLVVERRLLQGMPPHRWDTAYVEARHVHRAVPLIEWDTNAYSVPPELVGATVECRREVDSGLLVVRYGGKTVARHHLAGPGADETWDPLHRRTAEALALGRHLRVVPEIGASEPAGGPGGLDLGGDYDIAAVDLAGRVEPICECGGGWA